MKIDGFLIAMLGAVLLALIVPEIGVKGGPLHLDVVTRIGIALIFFLHGSNLSPALVRTGAANWRLHVLIHGSTFLLFPAIGFLLFFGSQGLLADEVRLGLFFLCALPSTISSSVAMTAMARGNVSGAIFDATLSGMIGMFATPFLVGLVFASAGEQIAVVPAILDVLKILLLPFVAGQLLRPMIGGFVGRHRTWLARTDRAIIVLIVFAAFCESTAAGIWSSYDPWMIAGIALIVSVLLALVLTLTTCLARAWRFELADESAAVFCGSKKSLANGAPIAAILFAGNPAMGMIMLPIILYHQIQLIVCTALAHRYARKAEAAELAA